MLMFSASLAAVLAAAAGAQSSSYVSDKPAPLAGDPDKVVCQQQEAIGTRLGAKKVCLTVREWQARQLEDRDQLQKGQSDTRTRLASDPPRGG